MKHFMPAGRSAETIAGADVLIVTVVTRVNHSLEEILKIARPGAEVTVVGRTATLLPYELFERGVRVVGGVWVKKPDGYGKAVLQIDLLSSTGVTSREAYS